MMEPNVLRQKLSSIDGKDYAAYQSLLGAYVFPLFKLIVEQIPKDPYAPPHTGIYRIVVGRDDERIVHLEIDSRTKELAARDFLARSFYEVSHSVSAGVRGTGFSGIITINQPGQSILERNSVIVTDQTIEVRCFLGLPANGRKIEAGIAAEMFLNEVPEIVNSALLQENQAADALKKHIEVTEDAEYLRNKLSSLDLVAFIANDSILPRESGTSDRPMSAESAVPFTAPADLLKEIDLPHAGPIKGMGIPKGVSLIVGGGYHGKSTLLNVLESGIYNHIPGDGREHCVSLAQTAKIRAYSGRSIVKTNISSFIKDLPFQKDTSAFSTENASGSTSQAANIVEAIEAGAEVLLMDEDTCATNFMIRDTKMQQLVAKKDEPITTYIDKVRQIYLDRSISTVLVLGGVGDYFDVSDRVVQMVNYLPFDVTPKAREIAECSPAKRTAEDHAYPFLITDRIPLPDSVSPLNQHGKFSVYAKEIHRLNFGKHTVDLTDLEQLMELSQTKALGFALEYSKKYMDSKTSLREIVVQVIKDIEENGLDVLSDKISGHFAWFRDLELAFTLNRLREFDVVQRETEAD